jgi:hypothetical protein
VLFIIIKYLVTAGVVVAVSEIAKHNDRLGALMASLPLVTLLTLFWMYFENQSPAKIANHAYYTFWYVIPTLPMFLVFPWLFTKMGFWGAISASAVITVVCFLGFALFLRRFGIQLI